MNLYSLLVLLQLAACAYTKVTSLHFDDFCMDEIDKKHVVLKKFRGKGQCICFETGTYDFLKSCPPGRFQVKNMSCVTIPNTVKGIAKVGPTLSKRTIPYATEQFKDCSHSRVKRKAKVTPQDPMDEDFTGETIEIGHMVMRNLFKQNKHETLVKLSAGLLEKPNEVNSFKRIMRINKDVMQKTCKVVKSDIFDEALATFMDLQFGTYLFQEPPIDYGSLTRIDKAMRKCLYGATPHMFVIEAKKVKGGPEVCENVVTNECSEQTVMNWGEKNEEIRNVSIPAHGNSEIKPGVVYEPLIETVWKMFVSTQLYCYPYFAENFNDFHTYVDWFAPLFTNEIQDFWLKDAYGNRGYDLRNPKHKLYGGLLNNPVKNLREIDKCVGASKAVSPYPHFWTRPARTTSRWNKRNKRSLHDGDNVPGKVCQRGDIDYECRENLTLNCNT